MKAALVHDYINEFGGAERVLQALSEAFPDAPIYTSFYRKGSPAWEYFKDKDIRVSWAHYIPFFASRLHSPLRFLAPLIWGSFDFKDYDVVITSAGWYITKGVVRIPKQVRDDNRKKTIEICYCHTPPRWLYGYKTSIEWQKYWPIKVYAAIVGHFMRMYDFKAAQRVDYFIANSENTRARIKKFYRRDATVIYPPVSLPDTKYKVQNTKRDYYFVVSRIVGGKGLEIAVEAAKKGSFKLKIAGVPAGYYMEYKKLKDLSNDRPARNASQSDAGGVEFLGNVSDEQLVELYSNAKAFLALAEDEDFGITPVESMLCGTPVIAYKGGGYLESVIDGKTGMFFDEQTPESLLKAIRQFETLRQAQGDIKMSDDCKKQADKFSKERFKKEIKEFTEKITD